MQLIQVIHELRNVVNLRKISLKKLDPRADDLEFIRVKTQLKKSTLRILKPRQKGLSEYEKLMISIRTFARPLIKVS
jgi:hypothetical protein